MKRWRWVVLAAVVALVGAVGGPFVYKNFVSGEAPAPLTLSGGGSPAPAGTASGAVDGTWTVAGGSQVGYRVNEVLFGQKNEAVGRTSEVAGSFELKATTVSEGSFTVDLTTIESDQSRRDGQFNGRIMDTKTYPTAKFVLSDPVELGSIPEDGVERKVTIDGELTLRGTTKPVKVEITGRRAGALVELTGSIPIVFADWSIPNPSFGPVTTEQDGLLEFAIKLEHA